MRGLSPRAKFYRLNVVPIRMPALRQRPGDVPALALHFVEKICRQEEIPLKTIAPEATERLCTRSWPGNVRQLENAIEMAVALSVRLLSTPPRGDAVTFDFRAATNPYCADLHHARHGVLTDALYGPGPDPAITQFTDVRRQIAGPGPAPAPHRKPL